MFTPRLFHFLKRETPFPGHRAILGARQPLKLDCGRELSSSGAPWKRRQSGSFRSGLAERTRLLLEMFTTDGMAFLAASL